MPAGRWDDWVSGEVEAVRAAGRYRSLLPLRGAGPEFSLPSDDHVVSFASNDYLGLATHPAVAAAAAGAAREWGVGTGSSRLIVGDRVLHHELEATLAAWRSEEAALVFPTGYQANVAVMTALGDGPVCRIVSDELNHASIIDGSRLSRAEVRVYRHGDVEEAAHLVRQAEGRVMVVSDSVFSMDGDVAPVRALSEVCAREGALLVLDDAHAVFPLPALDPATPCLRVGTLSKALGAQGGYVTGPRAYIDLLVNRARSFIYTTALAPPAAAGALAALKILGSSEGAARLARLRSHVEAVSPGHPSPILPVILGSEEAAVQASQDLLAAGLLVPAIRPPTVPAGSSRLRVSLSADHTDDDVERLVSCLEGFRNW